MEDLFRRFRFDKTTHLGLGDIRLTMGAQEEILAEIRQLVVDAKADGMQQGRYLAYAIIESAAQKKMAEIEDIRSRGALPAPKGE